MSQVCIVIPTYEEAENLPRLVEALEETLQKEDFTLIVVDDNSPDGTADIAEKMNERYGNIVILSRRGKLGIGSAIRDGIELALSFPKIGRIVTMDADLSHDPEDVPRLLKEADGVDLIQGSRYVKGGKIIGWSPLRRTVSYIANFLCGLLFRTHLHEHTTYFRIYSRECAETVVKAVHRDRYEWGIVSLLVAKARNLKIKEVPITFTDRIRGKSKLEPYDIFQWIVSISKVFFECRSNLRNKNIK